MDFLDFKGKLELFLKEYDCFIDIKNSNCDLVNQSSRIIFSSEGECFSLELDRIEDEDDDEETSSDCSETEIEIKKMRLIYECKRERPNSESFREIQLSCN